MKIWGAVGKREMTLKKFPEIFLREKRNLGVGRETIICECGRLNASLTRGSDL
jgi:hypothetical protein